MFLFPKYTSQVFSLYYLFQQKSKLKLSIWKHPVYIKEFQKKYVFTNADKSISKTMIHNPEMK